MINWLASYPKSGSTWVRLLINAYWFDSCDPNNLLCSTGDLKPSHYQNVSAKPVDKLNEQEIICLRPAALMQIMANWPVRPLLVKTHHANFTIDEIPSIPFRMTDRAFYIVRDPRDVAVSYAKHFDVTIDSAIEQMNNERNNIHEKDMEFKHYLTTWSGHVNSWLGDHFYPVHLIRYEELHKRPDEVLTNILEKLDFDVDQKQVGKAIDLASFENMKKKEQEKGFIEAPKGRKFFNSGKSGGWKDVLSTEQADTIVKHHHQIMERLGYV